MKKAIKALPAISLVAYLIAVVVCIVNSIRGEDVSLTSASVFVTYVLGVIVLMSFSANFMIKKKRGDYEKAAEEDDSIDELAEVAAENEAPETDETETLDEEAEDEEDPEETEPEQEVDVISTEGAEEQPEDEEEKTIVTPLVVVVADEDEEEEEDDEYDEDDEENGIIVAVAAGEADKSIPGFARSSRYTRTYAAKLIQADDELKGYYSTVKNAFMSYKKVTCSVSREHERVRRGRTTVGIMKVRGKSLLVYLALDPKQFEGTMYVGEDVSGTSKYSATPFLYRVNGPRKAARAVKLIAMIAEKLEMAPTTVPASEDYVARFPYEDTDALVEKGLIIDNIAEAERKAEEARIAAEEAEAAANKAIEDAIKAKEHAERVSERSERTVDEIEAAEEAKAAKQEVAEG